MIEDPGRQRPVIALAWAEVTQSLITTTEQLRISGSPSAGNPPPTPTTPGTTTGRPVAPVGWRRRSGRRGVMAVRRDHVARHR